MWVGDSIFFASDRDGKLNLYRFDPATKQTRQVTATVVGIDLEKRTATLGFQDGSTKAFPVRSDIDLSKHKVGEQVVFRITEMIAIRIEKP